MTLVNNDSNNIVDIESNLLSAILNQKEYLVEAINLHLKPSDFFVANYRLIYDRMLQLFSKDGLCDPNILIKNIIDEHDNEDLKTDFKKQILDLLSLYSGPINIKEYILIVKKDAVIRNLKKFGENLIDFDYEYDDFDHQLWNLQKQFQDIINFNNISNMLTSKEIIDEYLSVIEKINNSDHEISGIASGYNSIDEFTGGFQPGDLIILAARPSIGKTALAINFLINAAEQCQSNECVVMFSLEMSSSQLIERAISCKSMVNSREIKSKLIPQSDMLKVKSASEIISKLPIYINEDCDSSILSIQSKLKEIQSSKKIKLIVIDYLQLISNSQNKYGSNRQQEVAQISRTLKAIARELKVPVIAISQLSRKIEERKGKERKPILSDLRESGSIEQDADLVVFLDYDRSQVDENNSDDSKKTYNSSVIVDFIIAKHRNGATGEVKLKFDKQFGKFTNYGN